MAVDEGTVGLVSSPERTFGDECTNRAEVNQARLLQKSAAGANSQTSKALALFKGLIYVRYNDHVLFNRGMALSISPLVREATGWLVYECEEYITVTFDRDAGPPTLKGDPKATGMALIRSDIVEFQRLDEFLPLQSDFENHLNPLNASMKKRVRASRKRSEKLREQKTPNRRIRHAT